MSRVCSALQVERRPDGRRRLLRGMCVDISDDANGGEIVHIHEGFVTDYQFHPGNREAIDPLVQSRCCWRSSRLPV